MNAATRKMDAEKTGAQATASFCCADSANCAVSGSVAVLAMLTFSVLNVCAAVRLPESIGIFRIGIPADHTANGSETERIAAA